MPEIVGRPLGAVLAAATAASAALTSDSSVPLSSVKVIDRQQVLIDDLVLGIGLNVPGVLQDNSAVSQNFAVRSDNPFEPPTAPLPGAAPLSS